MVGMDCVVKDPVYICLILPKSDMQMSFGADGVGIVMSNTWYEEGSTET